MKNKERKLLQLNIAKENVDFYFKLLKERFRPSYDEFYIKELLRTSQAFNIRLTREDKLKFCRKCLTFFDVNTREVRFDSKSFTKEYICKKCGAVRRFKYK